MHAVIPEMVAELKPLDPKKQNVVSIVFDCVYMRSTFSKKMIWTYKIYATAFMSILVVCVFENNVVTRCSTLTSSALIASDKGFCKSCGIRTKEFDIPVSFPGATAFGRGDPARQKRSGGVR